MASNQSLHWLIGGVITALVLVIAAFNFVNLVEAFGSGPPYYGRTTNMDKWSNPVPMLVVVDLLGLVAIGGYVWYVRRKR